MPASKNDPKRSIGYSLEIRNGARGAGKPSEYLRFVVWDTNRDEYDTGEKFSVRSLGSLMGDILTTINNPWPTTTFWVTYSDPNVITGITKTKSPKVEDPDLSFVTDSWAKLRPDARDIIVRIVRASLD
jgi:hypothetical protein